MEQATEHATIHGIHYRDPLQNSIIKTMPQKTHKAAHKKTMSQPCVSYITIGTLHKETLVHSGKSFVMVKDHILQLK